jgi:hypothetical protein
MKKMTFVSAMRDYFGSRPGGDTTPTAFLHEMKALTSEDKAWFRTQLATVGYEIVNA